MCHLYWDIVQTQDLISVLFFLALPGFFPLSETRYNACSGSSKSICTSNLVGVGEEEGTGSDSREQRPHFQNIFLARLFSDESSMFSFGWQLPPMRCIVSPSPIRPRILLK